MTRQPAGPRGQLTFRALLMSISVLACVTLMVGLACSLFGQHGLDGRTWMYRAFRLMAVAVVGAGLAAGGTALQGLLRNPLAEPYILGISSGAGVGVLAGKVLIGSLALSTPILALAGALVTCGVVYGIAQRRGRLHPFVLLLSGVIVNVFNGAIMFTLLLLADRDVMLDFVYWSMGQVPEEAYFRYGLLGFCACFVAGGWAILLLRSAAMNTMSLGDEVARSSGVPVHWLRIETFIVVGLMTAAAVCLAGPIGFVGLIVPHICRLILGPDHRRLVVFSAFGGAMFLMIASTFCNTAGPALGVGKIPIGVVTALAGGPFFIWLLRRGFRRTST